MDGIKDKTSKENLERIKEAKEKLLNEVSKIKDADSFSGVLMPQGQIEKIERRLAEKNMQHMETVHKSKKEISKHKKLLNKTERRLSHKNKKMMALATKKKLIEQELNDRHLELKDLEHLLLQKDNTIKELKQKMDYESNNELEKLSEKVNQLENKLRESRLDLAKRDAVIHLLEKPEFDYSQLVDFDIRNIKTRHVGYPEVAQVEELTFHLQNIISEPIKDVVCDIVIENSNRRIELDNIPVKMELKPKEKVSKTVHIYKHLRSKGMFKVTVFIKQRGHKAVLVEQSKTINI